MGWFALFAAFGRIRLRTRIRFGPAAEVGWAARCLSGCAPGSSPRRPRGSTEAKTVVLDRILLGRLGRGLLWRFDQGSRLLWIRISVHGK